jgi:hypothetical protein
MDQERVSLVSSAYDVGVRLEMELPATALDAARAALIDLTLGKAMFPEIRP